jgi:two-component system sensor histidine kinase and response regulator WspE
MGLAGESLVESRWLYPFVEALIRLKKHQNALTESFDQLRDSLREEKLNQLTQHCLTDLQNQLNEGRHQLNERLGELDDFIRRHASLSDRLYQEVINSRMRPFADGVEAFPRMIRDLARQLGKRVKLEIEGKSTPVDRDILEKLESPLSHLLRNAVDHGIELPAERQAAGKSPEGVIKLEARHRGGMLAITVSDDGRGINIEQLRRKIVEKNLISAEMASRLTDSEVVDFLFLPGFSTSHQVTEISGRGVGLDIVQSAVQEVGGVVRTVFTPGKGMVFHLQLPLTLSVIRALLVEISGEAYAFPLARIDQVFLLNRERIDAIENRQFFHYEGQNIGLVPAWQVLELSEPLLKLTQIPVIILKDRLNSYGLVVDRLIGEKELVVQELDSRLGKVADVIAGALMEDGAPVLIIDVEDIVRSIDNLLSGGRLMRVAYTKDMEVVQPRKRVLVVDDSITVREVECRLLQNQGYEVETAVNGIEGWNAVRIGHYDLVVTDVDMPRMNGIELVRAIKGDERLRNLPVMIVSYKEGEEDRLLGLEAGADYYLTKSSFHDATLLNAVYDLIGQP